MPYKHKPVRDTARGVVIRGSDILLMERWWDGRHYFSIPGGGVETGETSEQAVVREIMEETMIRASVERQLYVLPAPDGSMHHIFLCRYEEGEPAIDPGSEEAHKNEQGTNIFKPGWQPLNSLHNLPFRHWTPIRDQLVVDLQTGFDDEVKILAAGTAE